MKKNHMAKQNILWQDASDETIVCYCQKVDKGTILSAIRKGACDIKAVQEATTAGIGGHCKQVNPRRRCCHPDIAELLRLYGGRNEKSNGIEKQLRTKE